MSNYYVQAIHPETGVEETAQMLDDYFGPHKYGVKFADETVFREKDVIFPSKHLPHDPVNHPKHYTSHPSGVECIQIAEHFNFNTGNAIKYLWRAGLKNDALEDLKKAEFYIRREIERRQRELTDKS